MENRDDVLDAGIETLRKEGEALLALSVKLGNNFLQAVELILKCGGRVAVCGMGKSGHIARKIAATLASTGTLSYFLHPAEASHGDLGMIGPEDTLIAISNSGKTAELVPVIEYACGNNIPVIAMTHDKGSDLAKQAEICLELTYENEACPLGCAPTTSTTIALALGDALAMALLKARGFTAADFNKYHPGGALGMRLTLVENIMHSGEQLPLVPVSASLPDALLEITIKGFGCTGVIDPENKLVGIITDGDFRRFMNRGGDLTQNISNIMTKKPVIISGTNAASMAVALMEKHAITSLFVVENEKPIGLVHMHDCLKLRGVNIL